MIKRLAAIGVCSLTLMFCSAAAVAGPITYNIQNYPSLQNGFTLSGTITTDGALGTLTSSDITAWSYTITNGVITDSESSSKPLAFATVSNLTATLTTLTLAPATGPSATVNQLLLGINSNTTANFLSWGRLFEPPLAPTDIYSAGPDATTGASAYWANHVTNPPGLSLGGDTWVIAQASVPEPGTLTLAFLSTACLGVIIYAKRRRRAELRPLAIQSAHS